MDNIKELMDLLQCTEGQAKQIIESDKQIDKMTVSECESDLTQEQKASAKKARQGDRKPTVYNFNTRERKADLDKRHLIDLLGATLAEIADSEPTVTNAERQIDFEFKGRKFRIVLSAPRS